jgi:hypothetical protein
LDGKSMSEYDKLNLPDPYGDECWTCGFALMPDRANCYGIAIEPNGHRVLVCAVCFQVMAIMNKEYLHKGDWTGEKPMGGPFTEMWLVTPVKKKVVRWKVLDHEPWLEKIVSEPVACVQKDGQSQ